jgi:hypothetical protein
MQQLPRYPTATIRPRGAELEYGLLCGWNDYARSLA